MPQTRTVCALLDLNEVSFNMNELDMFEPGEKRGIGFKLGSLGTPNVQIGKREVIGDGSSMLRYLCLAKLKCQGKEVFIEENFYPRKPKNADKKRIIDNFLDYSEMMISRTSSRLTKLIIQSLIHQRGDLIDDQECDIEMDLYS